MKKEENFTYNEKKEEYLIKLSDKACPCWMLLIPFFLSIIFIIIILFVNYL